MLENMQTIFTLDNTILMGCLILALCCLSIINVILWTTVKIKSRLFPQDSIYWSGVSCFFLLPIPIGFCDMFVPKTNIVLTASIIVVFYIISVIIMCIIFKKKGFKL